VGLGQKGVKQVNIIQIRSPRWHDRVVLVAKKHVRSSNIIIFTKAKSLPYEYPISGAEVQSYPLGTNGVIDCYEVPIDVLEGNYIIKKNANSLFED
jgi:hypothetical protein